MTKNSQSSNLSRHKKLYINGKPFECEKPPINKIPKMTNEPSKLLEEKDIRMEEESSDLEMDTSKNSSSIEDKDSAYVDEKNPKLSENQRTYGEIYQSG